MKKQILFVLIFLLGLGFLFLYSLNQRPVKVIDLANYVGEKVKIIGKIENIRKFNEYYFGNLCDSSGCVRIKVYSTIPNCDLVIANGLVTQSLTGLTIKVYNSNNIKCLEN